MTKKYENYTREQLLEEIKKLKKQKKFGLVWEDKPEQIVEDCKNNFPVLTEVSDKAISEAENSPTHLIIEGDNFHSLSVLNVTHKGKIDVIYIDPPYNTGNKDFKYNDNFVDKEDSFRHSKWLSFMEKRLKLAKELLSETGVIFISIDDNEQAHLKLLCDSVFGENNFISKFDWRKKTGANDAKDIAIITESILLYSINKTSTISNNIWARDENSINQKRYNLEDEFVEERGKYYLDTLDRGGLQYSDSMNFGIEMPDGKQMFPNGRSEFLNDGWIWKWGKEKIKWGIENKFLEFVKSNKSSHSNYTIKYKVYQNVDNEGNIRQHKGRAFLNLITDPINQIGNSELLNLLGKNLAFSNPKPAGLIKYLLNTLKAKNSTILDFFAGSGTTGHAVLELNKEDGGNRQFILCTNNENAICEEVTYPRIKTVITGKRADGTNYSEGTPANLRYFKTDFIEKSEDTDENRISLTKRCYELLQIKESCYESQKSNIENLKIWRSDNKLLAVIFDRYDKTDDQKYISEITGFARNSDDVVVYRFSIDGNLDMDISDLKNARLEEIPEEILKTFNQIFKPKKKRK